MDLEAMAAALEASGSYRILRRLAAPASFHEPDGGPTKIGIVIDVETTGLDVTTDEIIELGMIKFEFSSEGRIYRVLDRWSHLREPTIPIPDEATKITGITSKMVSGEAIAADYVERFIGDSVLILAHNAPFDRRFCERAWPGFARKHWACSSAEIAWRSHGHTGARLAYLLNEHGLFTREHRALNDCEALLTLLARGPASGGSYLAELLANARRPTIRIYASGAPFEAKDILKARGYRWFEGNGENTKAWWRDVAEDLAPAELDYLKHNVFGGKSIDLPQIKITSIDRYSERG